MKLKRVLKWTARGAGSVIALVLIVAGYQVFSFERTADRSYAVAAPQIAATVDSAVLARGQHLAESIGGCLGCHGQDLGGSLVDDLGPIGVIRAPNLTRGRGGVGGEYSDAQLARAIKHGIGADDRSLLFMPTAEHNWWPDSDVLAVVSFVRSMPSVDGEIEPTTIRPLGKILNQLGVFQLLSAEMIDNGADPVEVVAPEPTARYGALLAIGCEGCHGERLSGGPIPGAPSSLAVPANLTPHESGLGGWSREEFEEVLNTGVRPDGRALDPFMPIASTRAMDDIEMNALWAYLRSIEPLEFGNR